MDINMRDLSVSCLVPGAWYIGRGKGYHLRVEKIVRGPMRMTVYSVDRHGVRWQEIYRYGETITTWNE